MQIGSTDPPVVDRRKPYGNTQLLAKKTKLYSLFPWLKYSLILKSIF